MNTGPGPLGHFDLNLNGLDLNFIAGLAVYNLVVVQVKCKIPVDNGLIQFEYKDNHPLIWVAFLGDKNKNFFKPDYSLPLSSAWNFVKYQSADKFHKV